MVVFHGDASQMYCKQLTKTQIQVLPFSSSTCRPRMPLERNILAGVSHLIKEHNNQEIKGVYIPKKINVCYNLWHLPQIYAKCIGINIPYMDPMGFYKAHHVCSPFRSECPPYLWVPEQLSRLLLRLESPLLVSEGKKTQIMMAGQPKPPLTYPPLNRLTSHYP